MRAPHGKLSLEIDWATGETSRIPHWILRGFCPCAGCQGHEGALAYVAGTDALEKLALEIRDLHRVGNYALKFTWGDGHDAGIYTFEHLHRLGELANQPADAVRGQHPGG